MCVNKVVFMSISFDDLSPEQKEIVKHASGPLLVLAGPGTGKTEVLTQRIAYLNSQMKVPTDRIMAVTFSRKAANEMIDRLSKFPGLETTSFHVSTLHAESLRLLSQIGIGRKFLVADEETRMLIKDAAEDTGTSRDWKTLSFMEREIKLSKANNKLPREVANGHVQRFYQRYEELLEFNNAIDLDGLVMRVVTELTSGASSSSNAFQGHLLIDEYQDVNRAEYEFIRILGRRAESIFVVGDDDQSIYAWRGADPSIIRNFSQGFPSGKTRILEQSRRCPGHILLGAYAIVSKDPNCIRKPLCSSKGDGSPIHILLSRSYGVEAVWIAEWIREYLSRRSTKPTDIAVLAKSIGIAEELVNQLRILKIDTAYWRSGGFLSDKSVVDILAYLRLIVNKDDNMTVRRCLATAAYGIGPAGERNLRLVAEKNACSLWEAMVNARKFTNLQRWQSPMEGFVARIEKMEDEFSAMNLSQVVQSIAKEMDRDQLINVKRLQTFASSLGEEAELKDLLEEVNKRRGVDLAGGGPQAETDAEAVAIMSMHSSKGLGFKVVFILGMDNGILPDMNQDEWEQRRLCYVAMTRAKEELFLCHSRMRKGPAAKGQSFYKPSRFLQTIPAEHRDVINKLGA